MSELKDMFQSMDQDKNGTLTLAEIREVISTKMSVEDCDTLMHVLETMIDSNNSGLIDYSEFITLTV